MGSRTWFKIYSDKWLDGSIRQESTHIRAIWVDILALAAAGRYGDTGEIKLSNTVGLSDEQLCEILNISPARWMKAKDRLIRTKRIKIGKKGIILVLNWQKYQSEYSRQRPYRNTKLLSKVTTIGDQEKEKEKEKEGRGENPSSPPLPIVPSNNKILLGELLKLKGWGNSQLDSDTEWLTEFIGEFPQLSVAHIRGCRDYHSSKSKHSKGVWKTRIRNWLKPRRGGDGKHKHNTRNLPKKYTPAPNYED